MVSIGFSVKMFLLQTKLNIFMEENETVIAPTEETTPTVETAPAESIGEAEVTPEA